MKTYKVIVNKQEIEIPAKLLNISRKRAIRYFERLLQKMNETGTLRMFWSDVILLNILTTKMLKDSSPFMLEKILNPSDNEPDEYG